MDWNGMALWLPLLGETLCVMVVILSPQCKGKSLVLEGVQDDSSQKDTSLLWEFINDDQGPDLDGLLDRLTAEGVGALDHPYTANARHRRDISTGSTGTLDEPSTTTENLAHDVSSQTNPSPTSGIPLTKTTTTSTATTTAATASTTTPPTIATTTTTTSTTATTVSEILTKAISDRSTDHDFSSSSTSSSSQCAEDEDALMSDFGEYGLIAFVVTLGVAALLAWILAMVVCLPRCAKKRKNSFHKDRTENVSEMRKPGPIYRPRPSLHKNTPCVPTPLAMISADDVTSVTSKKVSRVVMTTDLDATSDPDADGGQENSYPEYSLDRKYSTTDRKFSTISTADTANVSTFLLRQTSLRLEEVRRKQSDPGSPTD